MAHGAEAGGGALRQTFFFERLQRFPVEARLPDTPPIVIVEHHVKTGRKRAVGPDKRPVLTGPAGPVPNGAPRTVFEGLEVSDRVDHRPAPALFVNDPVQKLIDVVKFVGGDIQPLILMFKMPDINEAVGPFIEMIIGSNMVLVSNLGQRPHIVDVGLADVDIEEDEVAVFLLPFDKITKLRLNREQGLWQAFAGRYAVHGQIYRGDACLPCLVDEVFVHKIPVGWQIHEKTVFGAVADNFQDEILPQQRLPSHERDDPAPYRLEPINGTLGRIQVHTRSVVVELETVMAIYVAAILGVKIAEDWSELVRMNSGSEVGDHPAPKGPDAVKALVVDGKHGFPPRSPLARRLSGDLRRLAPDACKYRRFRLPIPFSEDTSKRSAIKGRVFI
jgi:hypothetical protein